MITEKEYAAAFDKQYLGGVDRDVEPTRQTLLLAMADRLARAAERVTMCQQLLGGIVTRAGFPQGPSPEAQRVTDRGGEIPPAPPSTDLQQIEQQFSKLERFITELECSTSDLKVVA